MPEQSLWIWDNVSKRYRDTATGQYVGIEHMSMLRDEFADQQKIVLRSYTEMYLAKEIGLGEYQASIKRIIKDTYIDMYAMAVGGRNNMNQSDWGRIGAIVKEQYHYLDGLIRQIENGEISPNQAMARLGMYINSANEAMWRGRAANLGIRLPAYPGDGSTQCLVNCRCEWDIVELEAGVYDCYWRLGAAEHCDDCVARSIEWNPWKWPESRNG